MRPATPPEERAMFAAHEAAHAAVAIDEGLGAVQVELNASGGIATLARLPSVTDQGQLVGWARMSLAGRVAEELAADLLGCEALPGTDVHDLAVIDRYLPDMPPAVFARLRQQAREHVVRRWIAIENLACKLLWSKPLRLEEHEIAKVLERRTPYYQSLRQWVAERHRSNPEELEPYWPIYDAWASGRQTHNPAQAGERKITIMGKWNKAAMMLRQVVQMPEATRMGKRQAAGQFLAAHADERTADEIKSDMLGAVCEALGLPQDASKDDIYNAIRALVGPSTVSESALRRMLGMRKVHTGKLRSGRAVKSVVRAGDVRHG